MASPFSIWEKVFKFVFYYYYYFVYKGGFEDLFMTEVPNPKYYWTEERDSFTFSSLSIRAADTCFDLFNNLFWALWILPLRTAVALDQTTSVTEMPAVKWTDTYNAFHDVHKASCSPKTTPVRKPEWDRLSISSWAEITAATLNRALMESSY